MIEKRRHSRFSLRMPVLCEKPEAHNYRSLGISKNVSQGGLLLEVAQPLVLGTSTGLRLLTGDRIARAEALVVWTAEDSLDMMGLRFTGMTEDDFLAWEQLLAFQAGPTPRASLRIPVDLEVTSLIPPNTRLQGRVKNLSDSGMMMILPREASPQTQVRVVVPTWLSLPPVVAKVVWTRTGPGGRGVVHGLHFIANDVIKEVFLMGTLFRQLLH
jgi:hypothetical protein